MSNRHSAITGRAAGGSVTMADGCDSEVAMDTDANAYTHTHRHKGHWHMRARMAGVARRKAVAAIQTSRGVLCV